MNTLNYQIKTTVHKSNSIIETWNFSHVVPDVLFYSIPYLIVLVVACFHFVLFFLYALVLRACHNDMSLPYTDFYLYPAFLVFWHCVSDISFWHSGQYNSLSVHIAFGF
jgi:hypothetical protein